MEFLQVARLGNDTFNINIAVYQSIALSIKRGCKITKEQPQHIFMYFVKQTNWYLLIHVPDQISNLATVKNLDSSPTTKHL